MRSTLMSFKISLTSYFTVITDNAIKETPAAEKPCGTFVSTTSSKEDLCFSYNGVGELINWSRQRELQMSLSGSDDCDIQSQFKSH